MKYKYKIITKTFPKTDGTFIVMELPDEISTVTGFLASAVYNREMADWFLEGIDKVLNGQSEYEEYDGEIYGTEIRKDKTRVYDTFSEDEEKVIESYIETEELKELIKAWIKELEEHKSKS